MKLEIWKCNGFLKKCGIKCSKIFDKIIVVFVSSKWSKISKKFEIPNFGIFRHLLFFWWFSGAKWTNNLRPNLPYTHPPQSLDKKIRPICQSLKKLGLPKLWCFVSKTQPSEKVEERTVLQHWISLNSFFEIWATKNIHFLINEV